ncbi:hypothetical protein GPECTOR_23g51 [Gonium pectorale]|uniref:Uncharacterized protein n=1 Tax=Gonium pectorale TaxID=33097 RepID=A0A150GH00_GONPE|nr:hypothetical protein GPECTOR_23g51 [Gonium pectorale]|eukprot:KXZ49122.1 hypothetical protein GPECTOR_23g51 [Gonium pectorale]
MASSRRSLSCGRLFALRANGGLGSLGSEVVSWLEEGGRLGPSGRAAMEAFFAKPTRYSSSATPLRASSAASETVCASQPEETVESIPAEPEVASAMAIQPAAGKAENSDSSDCDDEDTELRPSADSSEADPVSRTSSQRSLTPCVPMPGAADDSEACGSADIATTVAAGDTTPATTSNITYHSPAPTPTPAYPTWSVVPLEAMAHMSCVPMVGMAAPPGNCSAAVRALYDMYEGRRSANARQQRAQLWRQLQAHVVPATCQGGFQPLEGAATAAQPVPERQQLSGESRRSLLTLSLRQQAAVAAEVVAAADARS